MTAEQQANTRLVADLLAEYGLLYRAELAHYMSEREPRRHLYDLAAEYPRRGGRSLRASICIAVTGAYGARPEIAAKTACAIELMHTAFLVHDDVEDESEERRGAPTLHQLHGVPVAINVGDALAFMALQPLFDNARVLGARLASTILAEAHAMARESIEGQAIELGWRVDNTTALTAEDYLNMVLKKTCYYTTIFPCRMGALIGRHDATDLDRFTRFGFFLGAAFQIQDDLLNLVGDSARYGKELNGDLYEGKRTLPLLHVLQSASEPERAELRRILGQPRAARVEKDVAFMRALMDAHDAIGYARRVAHGLAGAASYEFESAFAGLPRSRETEFLRSLPAWVLERT